MRGLYLHVPFCNKVCDYCDFSVLAAPERLYAEYVDLLEHEMEYLHLQFPDFFEKAETLYIGGGTPSQLPIPLLEKIFNALQKNGVRINKLQEVSMEFNPESCSMEKVYAAKDFGVKRFSLGIQTFNQELLKTIGRSHSPQMAYDALKILNHIQNNDIQFNADLMFMLPNQTLEDFKQDLKTLLEYTPSHISFYGLQISPQTMLESKIRRGKLFVDESLYAPMYKVGVELLETQGFHRYEVSNFALLGKESLHNKNYWRRGEYLGIGPGAHSFINKIRFNAPMRYSHWKSWIKNGCPDSLYEKDILDRNAEILEEIWLSLRQAEGLDIENLQRKYDYEVSKKNLTHWYEKGFLGFNKNKIFLIGDGWLFMDQIVNDLSI